MLSELKDCRQVPGEPRRRWFSDEQFDLIVWYDEEESVLGFQLCYDKAKDERALTWMAATGYNHRRVDTGEMYGRRTDSLTPVLVPDGVFDPSDVARQFRLRARDLEPNLNNI
jgi:hypothetical protein